MIHSHYFISPKPGMPVDEFFTYWRKRHIRAVTEPLPQIRRYLQSHRTAELKGDSHFQGAAESWFDSLDDMLAMRNGAAYPMMLKDELNFIDLSSVEFLVTTERVIVEGERQPGMIKVVLLLKRKAGLTPAEFQNYWGDVHGPVVAKMPGIRRYVQCPTISTAYAIAEPKWDGCAHIWFDDVESAKRAVKSDEYVHGAVEDGKNFVSQSTLFWAREHLIIWPR